MIWCLCLFQVDALQGHRVIDVACGSGDAQTLCLTDDDIVWSWGDGDYGKLGRGGSDGCKTPMKVRQFFSGGHTEHSFAAFFCHVEGERDINISFKILYKIFSIIIKVYYYSVF